MNKVDIALPLGSSKECPQIALIAVVANETLCIPPLCEMEIMVRVPAVAEAQTWVVESCPSGECATVVVARVIVTPDEENIPVRILNPRDEPVSLKKGQKIARMEPLLEDFSVAAAIQEEAEVKNNYQEIVQELVAQASSQLTTGEQNSCLRPSLSLQVSLQGDRMIWGEQRKSNIRLTLVTLPLSVSNFDESLPCADKRLAHSSRRCCKRR